MVLIVRQFKTTFLLVSCLFDGDKKETVIIFIQYISTGTCKRAPASAATVRKDAFALESSTCAPNLDLNIIRINKLYSQQHMEISLSAI